MGKTVIIGGGSNMNKYAKKISLILAMTMLTVNTAYAEIGVKVNGESISFSSAEPVIEDGRTLIPLRGVFEKLGYDIAWIADTKTAVLTNGENEISVTALSPVLNVNGSEKTLDVSAKIIDGYMYIPLRAIGEAGGASVSWNSETKVASITSTNYNADVQENDAVHQYISQKRQILSTIDFTGFEKTLFNDVNDSSTDVVGKAKKMLPTLQSAYSNLSALSVPSGYENDSKKTLTAIQKMQEICNAAIQIYGNGEYAGLDKLVEEIENLNKM
jgi:hypothetical protein